MTPTFTTPTDRAEAERVLASAKDGDLVHIRPPAPPDPLVLIERAIQKGMSPADLKELFELQRQHTRDVAAERFATAITSFQAEMPEVLKRKTGGLNGAYKYAPFEHIMEAAAPLLARHKIVVTFSTDDLPNSRIKVTCRVRVGIHVEETALVVPVPARIGGENTVNETQKFGAALSYGKRYCFCASLNVVLSGEDTDAEALFENVTEQELGELEKTAEQRGINVPEFMKYLGVASDSLADIPRAQFSKAMNAMKKKPVREAV